MEVATTVKLTAKEERFVYALGYGLPPRWVEPKPWKFSWLQELMSIPRTAKGGPLWRQRLF